MRFSRILIAPLALAALAACHDDGIQTNPRPPLGGVRFINAVPDGGSIDIRMVDQVEWSANSVVSATSYGMPFRTGTPHQATEAKPRHIRVFPTDSAIAVTSTILHDTTITIDANKNVTLMLVGSRGAGGIRFVMIDDTPPTVGDNQIAVRLVNATGPGGVPATATGYITSTATSPLPAVATFASVPSRSAGGYVVRDTGTFTIRATAASSATPIYTATAPAGTPQDGLVGATAGYRAGGSAMSAYLFPASTPATGAPQTAAYLNPAIIYFIDRIPPAPK